MAEYKERKALLNSSCNKYCDCDYDGECPNCRLTEPIVAAPAADVAPVRHGKWISLVVKRENWKGVLHDFYQPFSCSICLAPNTFMGESAFCPHCGARMDGAE